MFPIIEKYHLPITEQTLPTLLEDLDQRGLLETTLVVWMGEFGRTPRINDTPVATIGRNATPRSSPAAASGAASSMAHPTRPVPIRQKTLSAPTTWPQPSIIAGIDPQTDVYDTSQRPLRFPAASR